MGLGLVACTAGVVKAHLQSKFLMNPDRFWRDDFVVWNTIELSLGILAASLPPLKPLFTAILNSSRAGSETTDFHPRAPNTLPSLRSTIYQSRGTQELHGEVEFKEIATPESHVRSGKQGSQVDSHQKSQHSTRVTNEEVFTEEVSWNGNSVLQSDSEEQLPRSPDLSQTSYLSD